MPSGWTTDRRAGLVLVASAISWVAVMAYRGRTDGLAGRWERVAVPLAAVLSLASLYVAGHDGVTEKRLATVGETAVLSGIALVGVPSALHGVVVQLPEIYLNFQQNDTVLFTTLFGVLVSAVGFGALGLAGRADPDVPAWVWATLCSLGPAWPVLLWSAITADAPPKLSTTVVPVAVVTPVAVGLFVLGVRALFSPESPRPA